MSHVSTQAADLYSDAWRHLELWRRLCDREPVLDEELACYTLEILAQPKAPQEIWDGLLAQDALDAAGELLHDPGFLLALGRTGGTGVVELTNHLRRIRLRARARARARAHLARLKSHSASTEPPPTFRAPSPLRGWPFDEPLEIACRMLLRERDAPVDMVRSWLPSQEDAVARELLEGLYFVRDAQRSAEPADAQVFAEALEKFLGGSAAQNVAKVGGFLVARSYAFCAPEVPALSPEALPEGLPLVLPTEDADPQELEQELRGLFVLFDPAGMLPARPRRALRLHLEDLLSAVSAGVDRAAQLRCQVSRRIRPSLAIPEGWGARMGSTGREHDSATALAADRQGERDAAFRHDLWALTGATHIEPTDIGAIELAVFYAGGWPSVGWTLMRRALTLAEEAAQGDRATLSAVITSDAWDHQSVTEAVQDALDAAVQPGTPPRDLLSVLLEEAATDPTASERGFTTFTLAKMPKDLGIEDMAPDQLRSAVNSLVDVGLMTRTADDQVGLSDTGPVWRLLEEAAIFEGQG